MSLQVSEQEVVIFTYSVDLMIFQMKLKNKGIGLFTEKVYQMSNVTLLKVLLQLICFDFENKDKCFTLFFTLNINIHLI